MSRTRRAYHPKMCLRRPRTTSARRQQVMLRELARELDINLGNRALGRYLPHAWDDLYVAALSETKHLWKH